MHCTGLQSASRLWAVLRLNNSLPPNSSSDTVHLIVNAYTVKPYYKGHLWDMEKWSLKTDDYIQSGSIHMEFSITGHGKCDLLIQVTA